MLHVRVDQKVKKGGAKTLAAMGMFVSDAVRILLVQAAEEKALPFRVKVSNTATAKAMQAADRDEGKRFKPAHALFKDLAG
jgi:DNA-damage-inducible protein J